MAPRTRSASRRANSWDQGVKSSRNGATKVSKTTTPTRGRKRKSTESQLSGRPKRESPIKTFNSERIKEVPNDEGKPRLTTPDLEFDYDRSQLRDPRPTPGRVKRPRWEKDDMPDDLKERFYIPRPEKPKGRLDALEKRLLLDAETEMDPSETFHDLHKCHKKGRDGSPTYDAAGFELDWNKVDGWMRPKSYTKSGAVSRMEKVVNKMEREEREMYKIFFVDGKGPEAEPTIVIEYLQDHVSKDLGIPWHQIGPKQLVEWEKKGFPKQKAEKWWREPNETEELRMMKMSTGADFRKDL
ncbi:hypothetical protein F4774DRAFT_428018 [Daldinia eschscholtzii]|nr:hypothetical protein F4774DRAFT_428018 [Daldinia eschscholtzii]